MDRVTASLEKLMDQAGMTASDYLRNAIKAVDLQLGSGTAKKSPELVAALVNAQARDFHTAIIAKACGDFEPYIVSLDNSISQAVRQWSQSSTTVVGGIPLNLQG